MSSRDKIDEVYMALAVAGWFVEHYRWRAKNDIENSLVWECAADAAQEFADNVEHIIDELEDAQK